MSATTLWFMPAREWNRDYVEPLGAAYAVPGAHVSVTRTPMGQLLEIRPGGMWRHPWFTWPRWNGEGWEATVRAGFVNGLDPLVPLPGGVEAGLADDPVMPLTGWRTVGGDGDPIPSFFRALGVGDRDVGFEIDTELVAVRADVTPRERGPERLLLARDFYLSVARASLRGQAEVLFAPGQSELAVDYSVVYDLGNLEREGVRARLRHAPRFPAVRIPTLEERLLGMFEDEAEDRVLVSTVYMLSPEDAREPVPDASWSAFVRHELFWNLDHAVRNEPPPGPVAPLRVATGLAAGLGDAAINAILDPINQFHQQVVNAVNVTMPEGRFFS